MIVQTDAPVTPVGVTLGASLGIGPECPAGLRWQLQRLFTLKNPAWVEAETYDRSTADLLEWLTYWHRTSDGGLCVPRGATEIVSRLFKEQGVPLVCTDETHVAAPVTFDERMRLSAAQEEAVGAVLARRMGLIEAPAGSGKTCMGLIAVARRRQPTLWLTHTKELLYQCVERAGQVLGLDADEIGIVGDGRCTIGDRLTVALVQSLAREIPPALLDVGHVIVDEAHHAPCEMVASVVGQFPARYLLGLTATPYRRDGLDAVIGFYLGPVVARLDREVLADRLITPRVLKRDTGIRVGGDSFVEIVGALIGRRERNALIVDDVAHAAAEGRRCLVLTERVEHAEMLTGQLRRRGVAAAALHGSLGKRARRQVVEDLAEGEIAAVVATISLISEGFDSPGLDALFLATPMSYQGRVTQALGRVSRTAPGKTEALVYDYCDDHPMLWASYRNRKAVYTQQGCAVRWAPARRVEARSA